eukprot:5314134-Prymnesium_polylepis.1
MPSALPSSTVHTSRPFRLRLTAQWPTQRTPAFSFAGHLNAVIPTSRRSASSRVAPSMPPRKNWSSCGSSAPSDETSADG